MKFSTREDIEAPLDHVFEKVTAFDSFERSMMRRGVKISSNTHICGPGTIWNANFQFRGKNRNIDLELKGLYPQSGYDVEFISGGIEGTSKVELVPLSNSRTRVFVETILSPKTLSARLMVQSLKLAKSNLTKRYKARISKLAGEVEESYQP